MQSIRQSLENHSNMCSLSDGPIEFCTRSILEEVRDFFHKLGSCVLPNVIKLFILNLDFGSRKGSLQKTLAKDANESIFFNRREEKEEGGRPKGCVDSGSTSIFIVTESRGHGNPKEDVVLGQKNEDVNI